MLATAGPPRLGAGPATISALGTSNLPLRRARPLKRPTVYRCPECVARLLGGQASKAALRSGFDEAGMSTSQIMSSLGKTPGKANAITGRAVLSGKVRARSTHAV